MAEGYILSGRYKNILIISAEKMSKHVDWQDRRTCVVFGDEPQPALTRALRLNILTLPLSRMLSCYKIDTGNGNSPFAPQQDRSFLHGRAGCFRFAVNTIDTQVKLALDAVKLSTEDIDYFLLHQANRRIIDYARNKLHQPEEKVPVNIDRYANISSATIPVLIDEMLSDGRIKKGTRLLMTAFGAGLTTGTCIMEWE